MTRFSERSHGLIFRGSSWHPSTQRAAQLALGRNYAARVSLNCSRMSAVRLENARRNSTASGRLARTSASNAVFSVSLPGISRSAPEKRWLPTITRTQFFDQEELRLMTHVVNITDVFSADFQRSAHSRHFQNLEHCEPPWRVRRHPRIS